MRNWWANSSNKQKYWLGTALLVGVNCFTIFGLGWVNRGLFIANIVLFGLAVFAPSDYDP
jgi:hypothetical protein